MIRGNKKTKNINKQTKPHPKTKPQKNPQNTSFLFWGKFSALCAFQYQLYRTKVNPSNVTDANCFRSITAKNIGPHFSCYCISDSLGWFFTWKYCGWLLPWSFLSVVLKCLQFFYIYRLNIKCVPYLSACTIMAQIPKRTDLWRGFHYSLALWWSGQLNPNASWISFSTTSGRAYRGA